MLVRMLLLKIPVASRAFSVVSHARRQLCVAWALLQRVLDGSRVREGNKRCFVDLQ